MRLASEVRRTALSAELRATRSVGARPRWYIRKKSARISTTKRGSRKRRTMKRGSGERRREEVANGERMKDAKEDGGSVAKRDVLSTLAASKASKPKDDLRESPSSENRLLYDIQTAPRS